MKSCEHCNQIILESSPYRSSSMIKKAINKSNIFASMLVKIKTISFNKKVKSVLHTIGGISIIVFWMFAVVLGIFCIIKVPLKVGTFLDANIFHTNYNDKADAAFMPWIYGFAVLIIPTIVCWAGHDLGKAKWNKNG